MAATLFITFLVSAPGQVPQPAVQPLVPLRRVVRLNEAEWIAPQPPRGPIPSAGGQKSEMKPGSPEGPPVFEVKTSDESSLRATILDSTLELTTSFGPLVIPVRDVRRLEIGMRLTDEDQKLVRKAIADLTSENRKDRVAGREAAIALGGKALSSIRRAKRGITDPEIAAGLSDVETRVVSLLREKNEKELADRDTIQTEGSTFVGILAASHLKVLTGPFGEQKLKVADVRTARSLAAESSDDEGDLIGLPPNGMIAFQGQFGKVYRVRVTGAGGGSIWGTGTYTLDSYLPLAAVHAGAIKMNETGIVKVRIVQSPNQFAPSTQNGVSSGAYGQYPTGAYEIITK
jgi:hypothetical protein